MGEISIGLPELITIIIAVGISVGGVMKLVLWQFERRLQGRFDDWAQNWRLLSASLDSHTQSTHTELRQLERDVTTIKLDLANYYVRRDDWVRLSTTLDAKIDAIAKSLYEVRDEQRGT